MAQPIDRVNVESAWRALAGLDGQGWRTIPVGSVGVASVLAGRRFPGNEEAVLFGIAGYRRPSGDQLPSGRGFDVVRVSLQQDDADLRWIGISRRQSGNPELFAMMITDVIAYLGTVPSTDGEELGTALLSRIRGWQDFMQRGDGALSPEEEVGLVGELHAVLGMITLGVAPAVVLDAWRGPLDSLHDFVYPGGAIEVKSSLATAGFLASIASLEQLDDSKAAPLLIAATRLAVGAQGQTLPELVQLTRSTIREAGAPADLLEERLLHAGYSDRFADRYARRFSHVSWTVYVVDDRFPRLVHGGVPAAVRQARYDLELEVLDLPTSTLKQALERIGAI